MKKKIKQILAYFLSAVLLTTVIVVPFSVYAVSNPETIDGASYKVAGIWADPENTLTQEDITAFNNGDKTVLPGAVGFHKIQNSGNYYLFLPSNANCNSLKFWFDTSQAVTLNGVTLQSGQPTDALAAIDAGSIQRNYTLTVNGTSYSITAMKSGDVGAVYIDTQSGSLSSINSSQSNVESGTILVTQPDGTIDYDGVLDSMHGRGNASWDHATKRPYSIKLNTSAKLLGMSKSKKWALCANYDGLDNTLVRNQIIYDFSDYVGVPYQVHCKPVDLYVNQQYLGCYQLTEKPQIKSSRIDVIDAYENLIAANPNVDVDNAAANSVSQSNSSNIGQKEYSASLNDPDDVTGGYLYELEISQRWVKEYAGFCAYNKQGWTMKSCDRASMGMVDYSYDLLFALGSSVYNNGVVPSTATSRKYGSWLGTTVNNPAPAEQYHGKKWNELLDAESAVIYYWTQEYFCNLDASTSSTYFFKDSDSIDPLLYAGPVWDMDNSWGYNKNESRWNHSRTSAEDWYAKNCGIYRWNQNDPLTIYNADDRVPRSFYGALCYNCPDFWTMAEDYWYSRIEPATQILFGNTEDPTGKLHAVAWYVNNVAKCGTMNNVRHGVNSGVYDTADITSKSTAWLVKRNNWLNGQISKKAISDVSAEAIASQNFDGTEKKPSVTLTYSGVMLEEGADYTLDYANNVLPGIAEITVTGTGRFTGTMLLNFTIEQGAVPQASLPEAAYAGDTLEADIAEQLTDYVTYQWYVNGSAVSGETGSQYVVREGDAGKTVALAVTGNGTELTALTVMTNACTILDGVRPTGYDVTIASWNYDYTADALTLDSQNDSGVYRYTATGGEKAADAALYATIDTVNPAKIKWIDVGDEFNQPVGTLAKDRVPVIEPSSKNGIAWALYPYYETAVTTKGYENITFSARLGGTKKAPASWKVQYSLNGTDFTDVDGATYRITANKTMVDAFQSVALPPACDNKNTVYIRVISNADTIISPPTTKYTTAANMYSGAAAINNIEVKGALLSAITSLDAPEVLTSSGTEYLYSTDTVTVHDTNGGANVYYSLDGGTPQQATGAFNPFDSTAARGDTVTITAYAQFESVLSPMTTCTVVYRGANINEFSYHKYPDNETDGAVRSTGGDYGKSALMTANADGTSQYPPLWNDNNQAFAVSPDDGLKWAADSGFTFRLSTAGYTDIRFNCNAYTTASGPKSASLQYSTDGEQWNDVSGYHNVVLPTALSAYMSEVPLPDACSNQETVYVRLVTTENLTNSGTTLHNNQSKGNFYLNNIVFSGETDGSLRMPYTEKNSAYFGNGAIEYTSPDGAAMKYRVSDPTNAVIAAGSYPADGIVISTLNGFNPAVAGPYTVEVWCGDSDESSLINSRAYYYKGQTIAAFKYNNSDRPFEAFVDETGKCAYNTAGGDMTSLENRSTLAMYPNGTTAATLGYTDVYGVKVEWQSDNRFHATKNLDNPSGNGYWLITTSTEGYRDLTLNLEQLSSNKGPRDWGIAYSTNGITYTYIANSNVRAISNDAYGKTVETYNNFSLPPACNDKHKLYLKVFINGGESVDGTELDDATVTKGNTGIRNIELSGIAIANSFELAVTTVLMETSDGGYGGFTLNVPVTVNGQSIRGDGSETVTVNAGDTVTIVANEGETFERTVTVTANANQRNITVPVVGLDLNSDGIINAKDYALIQKLPATDKQAKFAAVFESFLNVTEDDIT